MYVYIGMEFSGQQAYGISIGDVWVNAKGIKAHRGVSSVDQHIYSECEWHGLILMKRFVACASRDYLYKTDYSL